MPRTSPVHYIAPSAISIIPNANGSANDLAVHLTSGAKIKIYCHALGIDMVDATFQEWSLSGKNRRLANTNAYTIYARLPKTDKSNGYLIFAPKQQADGIWTDKYCYITTNGLSTGVIVDENNWYVKIGEVSEVDNAQRTINLDTGILGTDQYNNEWNVNPDDLPLRVEIECTINDKPVGSYPYVYWGEQVKLNAKLLQGFADVVDMSHFNHWEILRNLGETPTPSTDVDNWPDPTRKASFSNSGEITLFHNRNEVDDFEGAEACIFTIIAWGEADETGISDGESALVQKASATVTLHAETYKVLSSDNFPDDPEDFTPSDTTVLTGAATEKILEGRDAHYLRKDKDDGTSHKLTMGEAEVTGDTGVGGDLNVNGTANLNDTHVNNGSEVRFGNGYQEGVQGGIVKVGANGRVTIQTDYLHVTGKMVTAEVEVQKVSHIGGKLLATAANMTCEMVATIYHDDAKTLADYYLCFFRKKDPDGRTIYNLFKYNDQAYCETFNIEEGLTSNFENQHYWRLVVGVAFNYMYHGDNYTISILDENDNVTRELDISELQVEGIDFDNPSLLDNYGVVVLSNITGECDEESTVPMSGDHIEQLGYRGNDTSRQGAIMLAAVTSSITGNRAAPSILLYKGINTFSLPKPFMRLAPDESWINANEISLVSSSSSAVNNLGELLDNIQAKINDVSSQIDESFSIYQGPMATPPEGEHDPARNWTTDDERAEHVGDFYVAAESVEYNDYGSRVWEYRNTDNGFAWFEITDKNLVAFIRYIGEKARVFTAKPKGKYAAGDMWANATITVGNVSYTNELLVCISSWNGEFNINDWRPATSVNGATLREAKSELKTYAESLWAGTTVVYYSESEVNTEHISDYYRAVASVIEGQTAYTYTELTQEYYESHTSETYYRRNSVAKSGLLTSENYAGIIANYLNTEGYEKSAAIIARVNSAISEITLTADRVSIGNTTFGDVFSVQGNYVKAQNLAVEGFINRGVAHIFLNDLNLDVCHMNEGATQIAGANVDGIQNSSYSLDLLLLPDIIEFTSEANPPAGAQSTTTFIFPSVALLNGNAADPSYIRPYTKYDKGGYMTLTQMRSLIGRRFIIINKTTTQIKFHVGAVLDELSYNTETHEYSGMTFLGTNMLGVNGNTMSVFEFCSENYFVSGADVPHSEVLCWKQIKAEGTPLEEFVDE